MPGNTGIDVLFSATDDEQRGCVEDRGIDPWPTPAANMTWDRAPDKRIAAGFASGEHRRAANAAAARRVADVDLCVRGRYRVDPKGARR